MLLMVQKISANNQAKEMFTETHHEFPEHSLPTWSDAGCQFGVKPLHLTDGFHPETCCEFPKHPTHLSRAANENQRLSLTKW